MVYNEENVTYNRKEHEKLTNRIRNMMPSSIGYDRVAWMWWAYQNSRDHIMRRWEVSAVQVVCNVKEDCENG